VRAVLLAHDKFGPFSSKTATCILRYPRTYETVAVIDRSKAGRRADEFVGEVGRGIPVVGHLREALALRPQVLVIGIAPIGGALPPEWRPELRLALESGLEIHSGLHFFLGDDPELARLAQEAGRRIWDVRRPERPPRIATGEGRGAAPLVVHTMGSDCNSGQMTATVALVEEAKRRGIGAAFAATGQTGILIGCDAGAPIDRVVSDFVAGAAEELVLQCAAKGFDLVAVEGQGSIAHPAYSGVTVGLMHGCFPDQVVYCHVAGRTHHSGYAEPPHEFPLLPLAEEIDLIERLLAPVSGGRVVAVSLVTLGLPEAEARRAIERVAAETGRPTTDPVRFGAGVLVDAVVEAARHSNKKGARHLSALKPAASR
jgi:D-glutamate N-acetyltransferase